MLLCRLAPFQVSLEKLFSKLTFCPSKVSIPSFFYFIQVIQFSHNNCAGRLSLFDMKGWGGWSMVCGVIKFKVLLNCIKGQMFISLEGIGGFYFIYDRKYISLGYAFFYRLLSLLLLLLLLLLLSSSSSSSLPLINF